MRLTCEPWDAAPSREVLGLLQREYTRWSVDLGWDLARDWAAVESARRTGLLAGWLTRDEAGAPRAWAFGLTRDGVRQVGAAIADDRPSADALLHAVCADDTREVLAFVRASEVITADLWRDHGYAVQPYLYLVAPTRTSIDAHPSSPIGAAWQPGDERDVAALLGEAYAADPHLRPFARQGTPAEWLDYVESLTLRPGCGVFSPGASLVVREQGTVIGVALVTSVGATTAHLVQLAVSPRAQGRGLARQLVAASRGGADCVLGASRLSLMVSTANTTALRVYAHAGFRAAGQFLAAAYPFRSMSTAPATGGESARR